MIDTPESVERKTKGSRYFTHVKLDFEITWVFTTISYEMSNREVQPLSHLVSKPKTSVPNCESMTLLNPFSKLDTKSKV